MRADDGVAQGRVAVAPRRVRPDEGGDRGGEEDRAADGLGAQEVGDVAGLAPAAAAEEPVAGVAGRGGRGGVRVARHGVPSGDGSWTADQTSRHTTVVGIRPATASILSGDGRGDAQPLDGVGASDSDRHGVQSSENRCDTVKSDYSGIDLEAVGTSPTLGHGAGINPKHRAVGGYYMSAGKEPGWYYVGGGQLRYHDESGWTAFEMDTHDDRALEWPPPTPSAILRAMRLGGGAPGSGATPGRLCPQPAAPTTAGTTPRRLTRFHLGAGRLACQRAQRSTR